jgi:hypothetical protein
MRELTNGLSMTDTALRFRDDRARELELYDPEQGLKEIAINEAAEKHWRRAKDATQLCKAIDGKIDGQADYVVYRDGVDEIPHAGPGRGKKNQVSVLKRGLPTADPGDLVIHRWRKRLTKQIKDQEGNNMTVRDEEAIARVKDDAKQRAIRICESGMVRGTEGTGEFLRYTPAYYIALVRKVLGEIDLDPATDLTAQETVQAIDFFTEQENGLERDWHGRVFSNPPYHKKLGPKFVNKLVDEYKAGRVSAAIMLMNNCTDTRWFDTAIRQAASVCFTHGRIRFNIVSGGEVIPMPKIPTQGQMFFYFGDDPQLFEDVFCVIGICFRRPSRQYEGSGESNEVCVMDSEDAFF